MNTLRYKRLQEVLDEVFVRVSQGKGEERHGSDELFEQQVGCATIRAVGFGFPFGQVLKKIDEAQTLIGAAPKEAKKELLDCMAYLAEAVIVLEEKWK